MNKYLRLTRAPLLIILLLGLFNLNAQSAGKVKVLIEAGLLPFSESQNLGLLLNVAPQLKVAENFYFGLRVGLVINPQSIEISDLSQYGIDGTRDNGGISLVPNLAYNFDGNANYQPYFGLGLGPYLMTKRITVFESVSASQFEATVNNQLGLLCRGGFSSGKIRFGLEYNAIFKADIKGPDGQEVGRVDNTYLGLVIGFILGNSSDE